MLAELPVEIVLGLLEVLEDGHGDGEARDLLARDGREARVLQGAGDSVLTEAWGRKLIQNFSTGYV